ncbi:MAG: DNA polymerase III subunit beta [Anaerolineaceae bacterium]|nr:DNA polymerase III subunit beta [Anaerolineaceae bacterium]
MTNLTIEKASLAQALGIVTRAVSSRPTLAALGTVLLKSEDGRLRLTTTNLEIGLSYWLEAHMDGDLAIALPARTFSDMVGALEGGSDVHIHANGERKATVKSGSSRTVLNGMDTEEFPPLPEILGNEALVLTLVSSEVRDAIRQVAFAASTDDMRPILQGVQVEMDQYSLRLAATDGFRLAVRTLQMPAPAAKPTRFAISAAALKELARILPDSQETFRLYSLKNRNQLAFRTGDVELVTQLLEGNFPDYKVIIPKSAKLKVTLATDELLKACKQVEIIAREGGHVAKFTFTPTTDEKGSLIVSAQSEVTGSSEIQVPLHKLDGPGLNIVFNVRFLKDVLEAVKTKEITFEANAGNTPAVIRPLNGEDYLYVVMPMSQN